MAWFVGRLVDRVAAAGKSELALPMYANAWIGPQKPNDAAGAYPSGGPVPRVFDVWHAAAPNLDWLSPDIYVDSFKEWATMYASGDKGLFVPETQFRVGNLFVALGQLNAFGFSPFGIEDGMPGNELSDAYEVLRDALPVIAKAQAEGRIQGFVLDPSETKSIELGGYRLTVQGQRAALEKKLRDMGIPAQAPADVSRAQTRGWGDPQMSDTRPAGLVVLLAPDQLLLVGKDIELDISDTDGTRRELARVEEGRFVRGEWVPGRVLNGDERLSILPADRTGMVRITILIESSVGRGLQHR